MQVLTPFDLQVLVSYYHAEVPYNHLNAASIDRLLKRGLMQTKPEKQLVQIDTESFATGLDFPDYQPRIEIFRPAKIKVIQFQLTDKGRAHVRQLCAIDLPVAKPVIAWHTKDGSRIEEE